MHINIPEYFKLYNSARGDVVHQKTEYDNLTKEFGKASDCIECGQCEGMCPQSLPIIKTLKDVANFFE
jgi:predicted aldo/keto reductase-like oxidoreductase